MREWWLTKDGDAACLALYEKHYSAYRYRDGRIRRLFCGPGEKVVLRTWAGDAFFVWRRFRDACLDAHRQPQAGINCAAFRNEGTKRSSDLVRQADAIADCLWPHRRHYTYVDPHRIRSTNPGCCFRLAGWHRCGVTKGGLIVLERSPLRVEGLDPGVPDDDSDADDVNDEDDDGDGDGDDDGDEDEGEDSPAGGLPFTETLA